MTTNQPPLFFITSKNEQKINAVAKVITDSLGDCQEDTFDRKHLIPIDIDDYGTSNQPFGFDETFICAYKRCITGLNHLRKEGKERGFVIALENGQYIDEQYSVNIGYDFCACVVMVFDGNDVVTHSSYKMPNIVKVPVCKEYIGEVIKQGKVHYTEIDDKQYQTGFDMTVGSLYERYRGMNKRDWMAESCGITRETQLVSSLTYALIYSDIDSCDFLY